MPVDYQKLYAYLVGRIDEALALLEEGDLVRSHPVKEILSAALLTAEEAYISAAEDDASERIILLPAEQREPAE